MAKVPVFNIGALNLKVSPFLQGNGQVLHALNVTRDTVGAWKKRSGYITFLGAADGSQINTLASWTQNDGTSLFVYRASGSTLYHSVGGTGAWTTSGGGTITAGAHFGFTVLDNTLIGGDGTTATRHTTSGTGFTNTTGAPLAELWSEYQGRVWGARGTSVSGTATDMIHSTTGTATDWTTDSSSIRIPGPGRINSLFKVGDRNVAGKDSGQMFRYDGFSLVDLSTDLGPSSPYSVGEIEGYRLYLNRRGFYGYGGALPEIISNPIERQIYNSAGSGIAGTTFDNAPGIVHNYDYLCSVGTITDNLTQRTVPDCVMKYDFQLDEWVNWRFANRPTAFGIFQDLNGVNQLIFGDSIGQAYQYAGTATSDNGNPIEVQLMGFLHGGSFEDKKWNWISGQFSPGCRAKIQIALSDTFSPRTLNWQEIGDAADGVVDYRFPSNSRGKFLFWKIYEYSSDTPFQFFGWQISADEINH